MNRATFPDTTARHGNEFNDFEIAPGRPAVFLNTGVWLHPPFPKPEPVKVAEEERSADSFSKRLKYPTLNSI